MAIGASYTGSNGKKSYFSLDGIPEIGSMASGLLGMSSSGLVSDVFRNGITAPLIEAPTISDSGNGMVSMFEGDIPAPLASKIKANGGIEITGSQFGVIGFNSSGKAGGIYGNAGGSLGFHKMSDFDKSVSGTVEVVGDVEADVDGGSINKPNKYIVIKKRVDTISKTEQGRIDSIRRGDVKEILRYKVPYCRYCTRYGFKFSDSDKIHPIGITWVAFGDEFSLATYDGDEYIKGFAYGKFKVNDTAIKEGYDPPVKVFNIEAIKSKYSVKANFDEDNILESLVFGSDNDLSTAEKYEQAKKTYDDLRVAASGVDPMDPNYEKIMSKIRSAAQIAASAKEAADEAEKNLKTVKTNIGCPYQSSQTS